MKVSIVRFLFIILFIGFLANPKNAKAIVEGAEVAPSERLIKVAADTDTTDNIKLTRDAHFGSTDNVIVGSIETFTVDQKDRVFIADGDQTTVQVFNPEGEYITSLGRQGRGPKEFRMISPHTRMAIHSNQLYVSDSKLNFIQRLQVFNLDDLSFDRTIKLIPENQDDYFQLKAMVPEEFYPLTEETFLVAYHLIPSQQRDNKGFIHYVHQDEHGKILSKPVLTQIDLTYLTRTVRGRANYAAIETFPFFEKSLMVASEEDYLYAVNHTSEFKITVYDSKGNQIRSFQHPFDNRPLNRRELIERYDNTMSHLGPGNVAANMIKEADNLPEIWPAIENMLIDDQNRLWISTIVDDLEVYQWWVVDASDGSLLARFEWPRDKPIEEVKNGYMYTLETDEKGVDNIIKYNIEME